MHGGGRDGSEQGCFGAERIGVAVLEESAFLTESDDAACRSLYDSLDILFRERRSGHEDRIVVPVDVDAGL